MDRYGYLINPSRSMPFNKRWLWLGGLAGFCGLIFWLISRRRPNTEHATMGRAPGTTIDHYTVTAPSEELVFQGAGTPFGIQNYWTIDEYHYEVDGNGISRLVTNEGIAGGIFRLPAGGHFFVPEEEMNFALDETREANSNILLTVTPFAMIGPGYLGYCTSGRHIGESVYITLAGQIGRPLRKKEGGELTFVPLEMIDQMEDIWSVYIKPGGE